MPFSPQLTKSQIRRVRRSKALDIFHIIILIFTGALLLICAILDNIPLGEMIIGVLAIVGLVSRLGPDMILKLAVLTFITVPTAAVISPYSEIPGNMAIFSFLLLLVGIGFTLLEVLTKKMSQKHRR